MDETSRKGAEALRRFWQNLTLEQREEHIRKSTETRRRNRELDRQRVAERQERDRKNREKAAKAAATRRRNLGIDHLSEWQLEEWKRERKREYKRRAREAVYGPIVPTEWRTVPGGGDQVYEFPGVEPRVRYRRNEKFWAYVDSSGGVDACWPWHGPYNPDQSRYGSFYWDRGMVGAHRAAWMLVNGLYVPGQLVVDHMCEVKWCVNAYSHLEVVTPGENSRRIHHREPENTRTATSFDEPWDDRWYPFGRRLYDENGKRIKKNDDEDGPNYWIDPLPPRDEAKAQQERARLKNSTSRRLHF